MSCNNYEEDSITVIFCHSSMAVFTVSFLRLPVCIRDQYLHRKRFFQGNTTFRSYGVVKNFREEFFTARQTEVWGKVIFLHLSVILFRGGTCPGTPHPQEVHPPGRYSPPAGTPPGRYTPQAGTPHPRAGTPPCSNACWDTVNKRAVRILLECILVIFSFCTLGQSTLKPRSCRDRLSYNLISHFLLQI